MDTNKRPSIALLAANEQLLKLRVAFSRFPWENDSDSSRLCGTAVGDVDSIDASQSFALANAQTTIEAYQRRDGVALARPETAVSALAPIIIVSIDPAPAARPEASSVLTRLHPILLGQLKNDGRETLALYWLIIKYIDKSKNEASDGWVTEGEFKDFVKAHGLLNRRSANAIIRQLDGVLVDRENGRLWHYSPEKVMKLNDYERAAGSPVDIPISRLTSGLPTFRATVHEAFLAGRPSGSSNSPISRETIRDITGASPESQRKYETITGIIATPAYAFLEANDMQESAWATGKAHFIFTDYHNFKGGGKGKLYFCRTLPNTYKNNTNSPLKRASKNGTKRINVAARQSESEADGNEQKRKRRMYYRDVTKAAKNNEEHYTPSARRATAKKRYHPYSFWQQQVVT